MKWPHVWHGILLDTGKGARYLLKLAGVTEVAVDDAGILQDIDISQDLHWSP